MCLDYEAYVLTKKVSVLLHDFPHQNFPVLPVPCDICQDCPPKSESDLVSF